MRTSSSSAAVHPTPSLWYFHAIDYRAVEEETGSVGDKPNSASIKFAEVIETILECVAVVIDNKLISRIVDLDATIDLNIPDFLGNIPAKEAESALARAFALTPRKTEEGVLHYLGKELLGIGAQGAAEGDNSDEMSIDAVCNQAAFLLVRKDGNEDGRFTTISKNKNIPIVEFEKNAELEQVLRNLFAR